HHESSERLKALEPTTDRRRSGVLGQSLHLDDNPASRVYVLRGFLLCDLCVAFALFAVKKIRFPWPEEPPRTRPSPRFSFHGRQKKTPDVSPGQRRIDNRVLSGTALRQPTSTEAQTTTHPCGNPSSLSPPEAAHDRTCPG